MLTVSDYTDVSGMPLKQRMTETVSDEPVSAGTCRCLFGPVDPADNAATLASIRSFMDQLNAGRWGFDFSAGRPTSDGRFEWTEVDCRRSTDAGNDVTDRVALQQVNSETTAAQNHWQMTSLSSSSPPLKRRRRVVTSSRRRRQKIAHTNDVIRNVVVCTPASQQHHNAKCRRHIITGILQALMISKMVIS